VKRTAWLLCLFFSLPLLAETFPSDDEIKVLLRKNLAGQGDYLRREMKRMGNKTIRLEAFASLEGDLKTARKVLTEYPHYKNWALHNINVKPNGSIYFLKINDVAGTLPPASMLTFSFSLDLPVFKHAGNRSFFVREIVGGAPLTMQLETENDPESVVESCKGIMKAFPAEDATGRIWLYVAGAVVIRPWILYEALPEKLINRESGERIQTILNNYQREEDRLASETAPSPTPVVERAR